MSYFSLPFDPTAYNQISGGQLAQLVGGITPSTGYGFNAITTDDVFGNPTVPSPIATPILAGFLWLRIGNAANGSATIYIWNPNAASNATLLQWQVANISSITSGSITGSQIAANTVTDNNIFSVGWGKLPSAGAVGGCLTGNMPNPALANGSVGNAAIGALSVTGSVAGHGASNIQANTIDDFNIKLQGISAPSILQFGIHGADGSGSQNVLALNTVANTNLLGSNVANQMLITDAGTPTNVDWVTVASKLVKQSSLDAGLATANFMPVRANSAGTAYEYKPHDTLQVVTFTTTANQATATVLTVANVAVQADSVLATGFGAAGTMAFTPLSAASKLLIECDIVAANTTAADGVFVILFQGTALLSYNCVLQQTKGQTCRVSYVLASPGVGAVNFFIYFAALTGGSAQINPDNGNQMSIVKITEYL